MRSTILVAALGLWACDDRIPGQCTADSDCKVGDICYSGFCIMDDVDAGPADAGDAGTADAADAGTADAADAARADAGDAGRVDGGDAGPADAGADGGVDAGPMCDAGFQPADGGCVDVDECAADSKLCELGTCKNTEGTYQCQCPDGYAGKACESCAEGYQRDLQAGTCVRLEYRCSSTDCGASIQTRKCQGAFCTDWAVATACAAGAICSSDGKSATCTECGSYGCTAGKCNACSSGACCKSGAVAAATVECKAWDEFRCSGASCGARAEKRHLSQHCDGRSFDCSGAITASDWGVATQCAGDQLCQSNGLSAASCVGCPLGCAGGECKLCNDGVCCDKTAGKFRPSSFACAYPMSFRCTGSTCGAGAQTRTSTQYCSGTSAACDGAVVEGAWTTTQCGGQQLCVTDAATYASCQACDHGCSGSACWPQCNPAGPCCTSTGYRSDCWYDSSTTLEWQNPGTAFLPEVQELDGAIAHCSARGPGWRVPTIDELRSLVRGCAIQQTGGACRVTGQCTSYDCWSPSCGFCEFLKGSGANRQYLPQELLETDHKPTLEQESFYWSNTRVSDFSDPHYWFVKFSSASLDYDRGGNDWKSMRVRCTRTR
jgi:hypothetical protein